MARMGVRLSRLVDKQVRPSARCRFRRLYATAGRVDLALMRDDTRSRSPPLKHDYRAERMMTALYISVRREGYHEEIELAIGD